MMKAHREELKARDVEIMRLKDAIAQRDLEMRRQAGEVTRLNGELAKNKEEMLQSLEFHSLVWDKASALHDEWRRNQRPQEVRNEAAALVALGVQSMLKGETPSEGVSREVFGAIREQIGKAAEEMKEEEFSKAVEARADEKAQRTVNEVVSRLPSYVVELLKGEYTLKCGKCGSVERATVTDDQASQLLLGQPVQLVCSNPSCIDEFSWGNERHSIPLTFGPILRLRLSMLGVL